MTSSLTQDARKVLAERIALGHWGKPEDIADGSRFPVFARARYIRAR